MDVEVLGAARGCTAVLKCMIPSFVKDLVRIISWVQEPTFYIYPSLHGGTYEIYHLSILRFPTKKKIRFSSFTIKLIDG